MQESHLETNIYRSHLLLRNVCTALEAHISPKEIKIICEKVSEDKNLSSLCALSERFKGSVPHKVQLSQLKAPVYNEGNKDHICHGERVFHVSSQQPRFAGTCRHPDVQLQIPLENAVSSEAATHKPSNTCFALGTYLLSFGSSLY